MWIKEEEPVWDSDKEDIIDCAPQGSFNMGPKSNGTISGDWWKLVENKRVIGYGWISMISGDAELLIAVRKSEQHKGYGNIILENLEMEASKLKHNKVVAIIQSENINAVNIIYWLDRKGFRVFWVDDTEKNVEFAIGAVKKTPIQMEKKLVDINWG